MRMAFCIPTANPALCSACFAAWRSQGWDCFALVNGEHYNARIENANAVFRQETYEGWGESFNIMAKWMHGNYDWLATGGDDIWPDPVLPAQFIGHQLTEHFAGTIGVCQPTKDAWAWNKNGTVSPICYAPIIGQGFAKWWNGGKGAFWPGYYQWFADNELKDTSDRARLLWVRPDVLFEHRHVAKDGRPSPHYKVSKQPRWAADHDLYHTRKAAGFPGHQPSGSVGGAVSCGGL